MNPAIKTLGLRCSFGKQVAVDGIELAVPPGSVYGFLGPNGAGKTTTIRLLLGLLKPTAGSVRIFGLDAQSRRAEAARLMGALVETPCHYDHLTARENLAITRRLLGAAKSDVDRVLETVDLAADADRRVGGFSLGMRQRLGIARALIGRPRLLLLDEPTNGLDPHGVLDVRRLIASLAEREGVTLFVSSHVLAEVEQTATHVGLMHKGKLLLQSSVAALRSIQTKTVRLKVDRTDEAIGLLGAMGFGSARHGQHSLQVDASCAEGAARDLAAINVKLVERGIKVFGLEVSEPSLEDIFLGTIAGVPVPDRSMSLVS
ncbi:ABC transporter ATP-binding protein [Allopontixanthobacter sp.]|uniref:ABC transporter ATP-binding protein n=1 Tax=Allopontixanthobacter sp. TaxID=2906452 RepID=UPI002AB8CEDF|nr:ABC transporter ATP-binding protein [Allopontixanthobacter sp.]MDZ4308085.1 ABC transporter ATP-binding protein [Allopontixanthobacter sp.]